MECYKVPIKGLSYICSVCTQPVKRLGLILDKCLTRSNIVQKNKVKMAEEIRAALELEKDSVLPSQSESQMPSQSQTLSPSLPCAQPPRDLLDSDGDDEDESSCSGSEAEDGFGVVDIIKNPMKSNASKNTQKITGKKSKPSKTPENVDLDVSCLMDYHVKHDESIKVIESSGSTLVVTKKQRQERSRKRLIMKGSDGWSTIVKNISPDLQDIKPGKTNCKHFLNGNCKFGYTGKGSGTPKVPCPYIHPKLCKKFVTNGTGDRGCTLGPKCPEPHPKMCHESLASRTCKMLCDGGRCTKGYHLHGTSKGKTTTKQNTKPFVPQPMGQKKKTDTAKTIITDQNQKELQSLTLYLF